MGLTKNSTPKSGVHSDNRRMRGNVNIYICSEAVGKDEQHGDKKKHREKEQHEESSVTDATKSEDTLSNLSERSKEQLKDTDVSHQAPKTQDAVNAKFESIKKKSSDLSSDKVLETTNFSKYPSKLNGCINNAKPTDLISYRSPLLDESDLWLQNVIKKQNETNLDNNIGKKRDSNERNSDGQKYTKNFMRWEKVCICEKNWNQNDYSQNNNYDQTCTCCCREVLKKEVGVLTSPIGSYDNNEDVDKTDRRSSQELYSNSNDKTKEDKSNISDDKLNISEDKTITLEDKLNISEDKSDILEDKLDIFEDKSNILEDKMIISEDKLNISEDKTIIFEDKMIISEDKSNISDDKCNVSEDKLNILEDKCNISEDKTIISEDKTLISEDKTKISENKVKISENKVKTSIDECKKSKKDRSKYKSTKSDKCKCKSDEKNKKCKKDDNLMNIMSGKKNKSKSEKVKGKCSPDCTTLKKSANKCDISTGNEKKSKKDKKSTGMIKSNGCDIIERKFNFMRESDTQVNVTKNYCGKLEKPFDGNSCGKNELNKCNADANKLIDEKSEFVRNRSGRSKDCRGKQTFGEELNCTCNPDSFKCCCESGDNGFTHRMPTLNNNYPDNQDCAKNIVSRKDGNFQSLKNNCTCDDYLQATNFDRVKRTSSQICFSCLYPIKNCVCKCRLSEYRQCTCEMANYINFSSNKNRQQLTNENKPRGSDILPYQKLKIFPDIVDELQQKICKSSNCNVDQSVKYPDAK